MLEAADAERTSVPSDDRPTSIHVRHWASWLALFLVVAAVAFPALRHDFRDNPPVGDQIAHTFLALSIAYDSHTLNFDRRDSQRFAALGWPGASTPRALFFQRYSDGWAASKPYAYPLFLAPFVAALGPAPGIAAGNVALLLLLIGGSAFLASRRHDPVTAALLVGAFYLASLISAYAYPVHTELFVALVALMAYGGAYMYRCTGRLWWALFAIATMGIGVAEKAAFAPLFAPLAVVLLLDRRRDLRAVALLLGAGAVTLAVALTPYFVYSDGATVMPYTGERYQVSVKENARPPWDGGVEGVDYALTDYDESGAIRNVVSGRVADRLESTIYYFVGRHTGVLVTIPLALLLLVATLFTLRRADRWVVAALAGVVAYIAFYIVAFPTNYYGGGQSVGSRYFVQAAPAFFALALFAPLSARLLRGLSAAAILLALGLTHQHLFQQDRAFVEFNRTNSLQRLLPFEANLDYADYYIR